MKRASSSPQQLVEVAQRRQRGLAHAHRADVVGLDERHAVALRVQHLRAGGGAHPAGGAAADDDDVQRRWLSHCAPQESWAPPLQEAGSAGAHRRPVST